MINTFKIYNELSQTMDDLAAKKITEVIGLVYEELQNTVTKVEFNELKELVRDLVEAQKRTETRVEELAEAQKELAEAQKRTEVKVEELAEAQKRTEVKVEELAEAQKRTEVKVEELAEAQKRTEVKVEELAEAQKRTEVKVEELAEAQKRTEEELRTLVITVKNMQKELGGISNTIGYELEDKFYRLFPQILKQDFKVEMKGDIERRFILYPSGKEDEINIYGEGTIEGQEVYIIGESKAQIGKNDIKDFRKLIHRVKEHLGKKIIPLMLCYSIHPLVEKITKEEHPEIKVYKSYELLRRG